MGTCNIIFAYPNEFSIVVYVHPVSALYEYPHGCICKLDHTVLRGSFELYLVNACRKYLLLPQTGMMSVMVADDRTCARWASGISQLFAALDRLLRTIYLLDFLKSFLVDL